MVGWAASVPAATVVVIDWVPAFRSTDRSKVVTISSGPPPGSSSSGSAPGAQASRRWVSFPSSSYSYDSVCRADSVSPAVPTEVVVAAMFLPSAVRVLTICAWLPSGPVVVWLVTTPYWSSYSVVVVVPISSVAEITRPWSS